VQEAFVKAYAGLASPVQWHTASQGNALSGLPTG
jgi:hypothetical protein